MEKRKKHGQARKKHPPKLPNRYQTHTPNSQKVIMFQWNTQELQAAETKIIKFVQGEEFPEEISLLRSANARPGPRDCHSSRVVKNSPLYKLDPFLDEDGILRVGGRLKRADLTPEAKHPAIVPKKGHVTDLIISHYHNSVEHQGRGMTLNRIRSSGLWIIRGSSAVSHHIAKCVYCQRLRGPVQEKGNLLTVPPRQTWTLPCYRSGQNELPQLLQMRESRRLNKKTNPVTFELRTVTISILSLVN